jgi:anthranilate synthase component 2/para-aminobenzoate synthetase component 2
MIVMIDNYDSFTYNLVQYLQELGQEVKVFRNDAVTPDEVIALQPKAIVISPGPCTPNEAGISLALIPKAAEAGIPLLGVCLGHQSIQQAFGGKVVRAKSIMHGKTSLVTHDGKTVYKGLSNPFVATRYHSLVAEQSTVPDCLEVTSRSEDGEIMGLRHKKYRVEGIQFHPESILTVEGKDLLRNFLTVE